MPVVALYPPVQCVGRRTVPVSTKALLLLDSNPIRKGATLFNDGNAILYIDLDDNSAVSSTFYSVQLAVNSYFEVPFAYIGKIWGIWAGTATTGNCHVREYAQIKGLKG